MKTFTILLNYNGMSDTIECLLSLLANTDKKNSIIIVDNNSPDNSYEKLKNWAAANLKKNQFQFINNFYKESIYKSKRITFIQSGFNGGFAYGNNIGIKYAENFNPDYIWLLNNDTTITDSTLPALISAANSRTIVGAVIYYHDKPESIWAWGGGTVRFITGTARHLYSKGKLDFITGASIFFPCEIIKSVGYLSEEYFMYWEDVDFCKRATIAGYSLQVSEEAIVYHKVNASSNNERSIFIDSFLIRGSVIYYKKFYKVLFFIPICIRSFKIIIKRLLRLEFNNAKELFFVFKNSFFNSN